MEQLRDRWHSLIAGGSAEVAIGDLPAQALLRLGVDYLTLAVDALDDNDIAVDCTVQGQAARDLDLLLATRDRAMEAGVHIHPQSALEEPALFQARLDLARLQVRWVHGAIGSPLRLVARLPLLSTRRLRRGRRWGGTSEGVVGLPLLFLAQRQLLAAIRELRPHALDELPRSQRLQAVGPGARPTCAVVRQQQHLGADDVAPVPMRHSPDGPVVAVVLRLVRQSLHVGLPKELIRKDIKMAGIPCIGHVIGGATAPDYGHCFRLGLRLLPGLGRRKTGGTGV
mmetsp:Transcript_91146/g.262896  ORF Transcript_91146/g.262896 Transcript_91146/m.262896 type:complete len:283 (-) Transcript_91146:476-1324(-)